MIAAGGGAPALPPERVLFPPAQLEALLHWARGAPPGGCGAAGAGG